VCVLEVYGIVITFCFVNEPCFCSELFLIVSLKLEALVGYLTKLGTGILYSTGSYAPLVPIYCA
jgi:hypothetical protein